MRELGKMQLEVHGLGLILYSPFAVAGIAAGEKYLEEKYWQPEDVARHVKAGTIAGFCTGSPGAYELSLIEGRPSAIHLIPYPHRIALGLEVRDRTVCVRDLYDLQRWKPLCPSEQTCALADGNYHLTVASAPSDDVDEPQEIVIWFDRMEKLPELTWQGVPFLGEDEEED